MRAVEAKIACLHIIIARSDVGVFVDGRRLDPGARKSKRKMDRDEGGGRRLRAPGILQEFRQT